MSRLLSLFLLLLAPLLHAQQTDGATENVINQPIFFTRDTPPSDQNAITAIAQSKDEKLRTALRWQYPAPSTLRLLYNEMTLLQDGHYFLCLFQGSTGTGNYPRVLILFTHSYEIKTWGEFQGYSFQYGTMVHPFFDSSKDSSFLTVNQSGRSPSLWFEKYRITPTRIEKLGEGADPTQIPDP